jgi:hypothetical protein
MDRTSGDGVAEWLPGQTIWDEALAEEIVEAVAVSPRSIGWLCANNPHWPSERTIRNWKAARPEFKAAFEFARHELAHELAFQTIEIADDGSGDARVIERKDGSSYVVQDQEFAARSKLKVESRRWLAAKLAPEVYGERIDANLRLGPILSQEEALDLLR